MLIYSASQKLSSVIMPACPPVNGTASIPSLYKAFATTTELMISPQHIKRSLEFLLVSLNLSSIRVNKVSVAYGCPFLPIADTTTIGVNPFSIASFTLIATCFRLSSVDTDVPPNFCTIIFKEISSLAKL